MYQNKHGRFTAPDPLLASASGLNPQTFNRYVYTGNNPINYTDPSGLTWCRNSSGLTEWQGGRGGPCKDGFDNVDNSVAEVTRGNFNRESTNGPAGVGSVIYLNPDGTVQVMQSSPELKALAQGKSVQESVQVTAGEEASEAAISGSNGSAPGGTITPRDMMPLPCPPEMSGCSSGNLPYSNPLSQGASLEDIQTTLDVVGVSEIPIVSQLADVGSGLISFSQGDNFGGVLSIGAAIPGAGNVFAGMKWGRRGLNALDHARDLGKAGERAAGITKPKTAIKVDGRNLFRMR